MISSVIPGDMPLLSPNTTTRVQISSSKTAPQGVNAYIGGDKTNEPGSLKNHLSELLTAYPALQLLTGDAIYAQRPLVELLKAEGCDYLFQVKANQPDVLDALKVCFAESPQSKPAHEVAEKRGSITKPADCGSTWMTPSISASV
jgi:hypothetical protein